MEAKDLRIGNWVKFLGDVVKINGITIDSEKEDLYYIATRKGIHTNPSFQPIELTEEILFKCGFEKYGEYHDSYKNNPFIIELSILGESYRFRKMINANESILLKEIKYLHQLQNILKELTGKELIYNE